MIYFFIMGLALVFCTGPLATLMINVSPKDYSLIFENSQTFKSILNTFILSASVATLCTLIGLPLSWLISRTDLKFSQTLKSILMLPYAIPAFIGAIGWIILANPQSGVLNTLIGSQFFNIYSFPGLIFVETSFLFTFSFLISHSSLEKMDSSLEEAARIAGASGLKVFFDISLPILRPAIWNSFVLVFLATSASFGVPALIGTPARINLITTQIFNYQRLATENGIQMALALSGVLMIGSLVLLFLSQHLLKNSRAPLVSGKTSRPSLIQLGKMQFPILFSILIFIFIVFAMPILSLALSAFSQVQGNWSFENLSTANFQRVLFETEEIKRALFNSLTLSISVSATLVGFAFFAGYFLSKSKIKGSQILETFASLPFSTPGTVVALAMIVSFSSGFWGVGPSLYNTLMLLFLAYSIKYLSLSIKTLRDGFDQIDKSLEEAAQVSGSSWMQIMTLIYFPMLKPAMLTAFFLVLMPVFSELTMSVLLTGPGLETVGTMIYQLQEYSDMGGGGASVLSLLVVAFILLVLFGVNIFTRKRI